MQGFEDPDHALQTYTQMYGVFFLMFTHSTAVFMKDANERMQVCNSADMSFLFSVCSIFFPPGVYFFSLQQMS